MRRWRSSLGGRIVLAALVTGVVAALVSAGISIVVLNRIVDQDARAQLHARVVDVGELSEARARQFSRLVVGRERFAVVDAGGAAHGAGATSVAPRIVRVLAAGRTVSRTIDTASGDVLVEAVPTTYGGVVGLRPVADVRATNLVFLRGTLLALAAGIAAAMIAGWVAGRRIGRPLADLASDARRLAHGERSIEVSAQPVPEIDDIAEALRALDAALDASERRQREFLLSVSHELRTPLTALRGYAEALADGVVDPDETRDVGRTLVAEADRLTRFTSDLLALARLEADDFRIEEGPVPLDALVASVVDAWRAAADAAGVELVASAPATEVASDAQRLRQVVDGLVENALRVSPRAGRITVTAFVGDGWGIEVADDGPGLDDADLAVAFERGILHERYRDERPVGSGLGLSIARRLVERLGGTVEARRGDGGGAVFRVLFTRS